MGFLQFIICKVRFTSFFDFRAKLEEAGIPFIVFAEYFILSSVWLLLLLIILMFLFTILRYTAVQIPYIVFFFWYQHFLLVYMLIRHITALGFLIYVLLEYNNPAVEYLEYWILSVIIFELALMVLSISLQFSYTELWIWFLFMSK